jgi:uncharacterized repeat protein (TIGR01451 family)
VTRSIRRWMSGVAVMAVAIGSTLVLSTPAYAATFPIDEPFRGATTNNPDWVLTDSAELTDEGTGWLRLTGTGTFEAGTAILNDAFSTDLGMTIDFDYATWGGIELGGNRADGFSVFLMDGSFPPSVGISGGGLGYTGLQGGYAGIGFDEFGNFSGGDGGPGQQPQHVVIRGSYAATTPWAYLTGVLGPGGTVETGDRAGVRHVRITVMPSSGGAVDVTVASDTGPGTALQTLISDFNIAAAAGQPAIPPTFKLGFSAATGGGTNNHEIRDLTVRVPVDLSLTKSATPTADVGDTVTYKLTAHNTDINPVTGAIIRDQVPATLTNVTWTCADGPLSTCDQASGSGNDVEAPVDLRKDGSAVVTVTGTVAVAAADSTIDNTAEIIVPPDRVDLDPDDNIDSARTVIAPEANLGVTKTLTSDSPLVFGTDATYDIAVTNHGPNDATGVVVTDQIPAAFDPAGVRAAGCTVSGTTLTCPVGNLAGGATHHIAVTAPVTGSAAACQTAAVVERARVTATTADADQTDNTATVRTPCRVPTDLTVTKTGPASVHTGSKVTYKIVVADTGANPATDVDIVDHVPTEITGVTWSCAECTPTDGSGNVIGTTATIPAGNSATVTVSGTATTPGTVTNTATAGCTGCSDLDPSDNTSSVTTKIIAVPVNPSLPVTGSAFIRIFVPGSALTLLGGLLLAWTSRRRKQLG